MGREVHLIISPHHVGIPNLEVGAGPYHILQTRNLVERLESAGHHVSIEEIPRVDESQHVGDIGRSFEIIRRVAVAVASARTDNRFPLVLAGNCNNSVGTAAGMGLGAGGVNEDAEIVWFDAHPDFDTPDETESGYFDVNGVAILAGQCWNRLAANVPGHRPIDLKGFQYVGLRDFKEHQAEKVRKSDVGVVWGGKQTPTGGFAKGLRGLLETGRSKEHPCMVHFDVDSLDTTIGVANFAAAPGGLKMQDVKDCFTTIRETRKPAALTIASFDPSYDGADGIAEAAVVACLTLLG